LPAQGLLWAIVARDADELRRRAERVGAHGRIVDFEELKLFSARSHGKRARHQRSAKGAKGPSMKGRSAPSLAHDINISKTA